MKRSVSRSLQDGDTSTRFIVKLHLGVLEHIGDLVNLFDLHHLDALLEAIHLRFHNHYSCRRAEHELDLLQGVA